MNTQEFPQPVVVKFDPNSNAETAKIFKEPTSRTLYLLWRVGHIVDQHFCEYVLNVANTIMQRSPKNADELAGCFPVWLHPYWKESDVKTFAERAWPYFGGEKDCIFELRLS